MVKVFVTICFFNPFGFWDKCTTYTAGKLSKDKADCIKQIDKFEALASEHISVPYRIQGYCRETKELEI